MKRREFLQATAGAACLVMLGGAGRAFAGSGGLLRPPGGQDELALVGACIHCDRCRSVCPTGCVQLALVEAGLVNARTPVMNYQRGYCTFCNKCIDACPTGALSSYEGETVDLGKAVLDRGECANCKKCLPACEYGALEWNEANAVPVIDAEACNGCGKCEYVCPSASFGYYDGSRTRAIHVERRP